MGGLCFLGWQNQELYGVLTNTRRWLYVAASERRSDYKPVHVSKVSTGTMFPYLWRKIGNERNEREPRFAAISENLHHVPCS